MYGARGYADSIRGARGAKSRSGTGPYENRYTPLRTDSEGETWQVVKGGNKRQRRSTGGTYGQPESSEFAELRQSAQYRSISRDEFRGLSTDEKLVTMFEAITDLGSLSDRVCNVEEKVAGLEMSNKAHDDRLKLVEYKSIDMEARSRRNNLIFRGHRENVENDNCTDIIRRHLAEHLNLNPSICIQRAQRLGNINRRRGNRWGQNIQPRPIIVNFRDYQDVELILENANKLRGTSFGINRDYPKEIIDARSKLWPLYKKARENNPNSKVFIGYPAKLIVNGLVKEDQFPDWRNILRGSRIQDHSEDSNPGSKQSNSKQSEPINITQNSPTVPKQLIIELDDEKSDDAASMTSVRSRSRSHSRSSSRSRSVSAHRNEHEIQVEIHPTTSNAPLITDKPKIQDDRDDKSENDSDIENLSQYDKDMKRLQNLSNQAAKEAGANEEQTSDTGQKPNQSQPK